MNVSACADEEENDKQEALEVKEGRLFDTIIAVSLSRPYTGATGTRAWCGCFPPPRPHLVPLIVFLGIASSPYHSLVSARLGFVETYHLVALD